MSLDEQVESEIDEDKVLRQLRHHLEEVLRGKLGTARHVVVCIVFEGDSTKQERHDS